MAFEPYQPTPEELAMGKADEALFPGEVHIRKTITELIKDPYEMELALSRIKLCTRDIVLAVGREFRRQNGELRK